jgi:hypothetical protein
MVPTFKSKILITGLYSMNPPDSRGVLLFTTPYLPFRYIISSARFVPNHLARRFLLMRRKGEWTTRRFLLSFGFCVDCADARRRETKHFCERWARKLDAAICSSEVEEENDLCVPRLQSIPPLIPQQRANILAREWGNMKMRFKLFSFNRCRLERRQGSSFQNEMSC